MASAVLLALTGVAGAILPALPGPPLSLAGAAIVWLVAPELIPTSVLVVMAVLTVVCQVLDYAAPAWLTRVGGGSDAAMRGATAGMLVGLLWLPLGLVVGPFVGALLGELLSTHHTGRALRVALLSVLAFLLTTGLKLVLALWMTWRIAFACWHAC